MGAQEITKEVLVERIAQGASMSALCAFTGLASDKLKELLASHDIVVEKGSARKLPSTADLVTRIEQGQHPQNIGSEFGVSAQAVHAALARAHLRVSDIRRGLHNQRGSFGMPAYAMQLNGSIDRGNGK